MKYVNYVNPFIGNEEIDLPEPKGIAAAWAFIKAQAGNTHPGACYPFGMVSACAYSGGYVTGYGINAPNTHGKVKKAFDCHRAKGFTHFHQSGTGAILKYYNYFRVFPFTGDLGSNLDNNRILEGEVASPGYYSGTLEDEIKCELTVALKSAVHRYTFQDYGENKVFIDFTNGGLAFDNKRTKIDECHINIIDQRSFQGYILAEGIKIYLYAEIDKDAKSIDIFDNENLLTQQEVHYKGDCIDNTLGLVFSTDSKLVELALGFSFKGLDKAKKNINKKSFNKVKEETEQAWEERLSHIDIQTDSQKVKTIFYTALYRSLIKPCNANGEMDMFSGGDSHFFDYATLWDQYKTHLPLITLLYPDTMKKMIEGLLDVCEEIGSFPNSILLSNDINIENNQAKALAHVVIMTAYYNGIKGIDYKRALRLMIQDIQNESNIPFFKNKIIHPITHSLDLAYACHLISELAQDLGDSEIARVYREYSQYWEEAYDTSNGLLIDSNYYEGNKYNYSFRLQHNLEDRLKCFPSKEIAIKTLDDFFGYGKDPVPLHLDNKTKETLNRFEGFNNEPDMETPYIYTYLGRHDRTCEIVRTGMEYMFTDTKGGIPGNEDSGALSSLYVFNAIGIFPLAGQPYYLIGSPIIDSATVNIGENTFKIIVHRGEENSIYVDKVVIDGENLNGFILSTDALRRCENIDIYMK